MVRLFRGTTLPQLADYPTDRLCGVSSDRFNRSQVCDQRLQGAGCPSDHCSRRNYLLPGHLHIPLHIRDDADIWEGEYLYYRQN